MSFENILFWAIGHYLSSTSIPRQLSNEIQSPRGVYAPTIIDLEFFLYLITSTLPTRWSQVKGFLSLLVTELLVCDHSCELPTINMNEQKTISRQRKKQLDYKSKGLCVTCGKPRCELSANYCLEHYHKRKILERRKYQKRKQKLSPTN